MFEKLGQKKVIIWVAGIAAVAFIGLVYFEWGKGGLSRKNTINPEIARVNGISIYKSDLRDLYERIIDYMREQGKEELSEEDTKQAVLTALRWKLQRLILLAEARKAEVRVSENQIFELVKRRPEFRDKNGRFNYMLYMQYSPSTRKRIEKEMKDELMETLFRIRLDDAIKTSSIDARFYYMERSIKRKIAYVYFPVKKENSTNSLTGILETERLKAEELCNKFLKILKKTKNFNLTASLTGKRIKYTDYFSFFGPIKSIGGKKRIKELEEQDLYINAFRLRKGEVSDKIVLSSGYVIIKVVGIKDLKWKNFVKKLPQIKSELERIRREYVYNDWFNYAQRNNKIIVDTTLLFPEKHQ